MQKTFIIANWKSNKTLPEAKEWIQQVQSSPLRQGFRLRGRSDSRSFAGQAKFSSRCTPRVDAGEAGKDQSLEKEIIVCPPFTLLSELKSGITRFAKRENYELGIKLGAQDISPFEEGAYTGEVNGKQIKEFADYVLIGHSERRNYFRETEEIVIKKIEQSFNNNLIPILCISDLSQISNLKSQIYNLNLKTREIIVAYEPLSAIGSGSADDSEHANKIALGIKQGLEGVVLYGGSITSKNVYNFTQMENIDGVLVGGASLEALEFAKIINNA